MQSFRDDASRDLFHGLSSKHSRSIPPTIWKVARRKHDMLNAAHALLDLIAPPANRLETLQGGWRGFHSIRVNDQYRIISRWEDGNAHDVQVLDYH